MPRIRQHGLSAYDQLRDFIVRGRLAPGARLIENDLASTLGISRTPVREAITRLVQDGLAVPSRISTRTQVVVAPLSQADLQELYTIMGALEGAAARRLSTLTVDARRTLAAKLMRTHEAFETIARRPPLDFERMFQSHNAFHAALIDGLATARLLTLIEQVRPHIHRYEYMYAGLVGPDYRQTFREHRAIVKAIRNGTVAEAERAVGANWLNSAKRLSSAVTTLPSFGDVSATAGAITGKTGPATAPGRRGRSAPG